MHSEIHLALHDSRAAELRAEADADRLAATVAGRHPVALRTRLGWALVEVGLRLAAPQKGAAPVPA
ncbi:hypothetical protein ACN2WE_22060 [Streptomyces sp. cg28]|uniref:hypothetical protein n=1 Tax=unclassified Streptomyces TaxID=2593676 RepID=UPI000DB93273|nr:MULTISPECIES: hypothetical protein [unclassified Streptomyces]MYT72324.1 hypothetical protein [Streptomyces sp. SID8367]RAJ81740.1 hypothetical protein K377_04761 [Streptomyces sp. PsTaAH-137]